MLLFGWYGRDPLGTDEKDAGSDGLRYALYEA